MNEQVSFTLRGRNPDVLTCIANLSNDEVQHHVAELAGIFINGRVSIARSTTDFGRLQPFMCKI